jgi:hypothetical protein
LIQFVQVVASSSADEAYFQTYALPAEHPLRSTLDRLFQSSQVLQNQKSLEKAGFIILHTRPSTLIVAKHEALPGYLIKVFPRSSRRPQEENRKNLMNRCIGAHNIRNLIRQEGLKYFTVPDKWLYLTPTEEPEWVLLVTHVDIVPSKKSKDAWKNRITHKHLEELYCIISHGYASSRLPANIPYTRSGLFSCIDTEQPQREPRYANVKAHLSKKMGQYWDELVRAGAGQ